MKNKKITVITPTYNRAYILHQAYESLVNQTNKSFLWMIIDDGSTDNTYKIVQEWKKENKIEIIYYKKNNGGKASALNYAFRKLKTDYWVCLDSDDFFSKDAIQKALNELDSIKNDDVYCGLLALRNDPNTKEVLGNKEIPNDLKSGTVIELYNKYKIRSEYIQFYKTSITKNYKFPEIKNEKFISPEYLAMKLNEKYIFKFSKEIYCYCDYQEDGLTKNKKKIIINNPKGYTIIKKLSYKSSKFGIMKIKHGLMYIVGSLLSKKKYIIVKSPHKIITFLIFPIAFLIYKIRYSNK